MRLLYTLLLYLLIPVVLLRLLWRGLALSDYWRRWPERFGFVPRPDQSVAVWVHAVSVGEALAAMPLIRALLEQHGTGRVLVTCTTPTGSARIHEALGDQVLHYYLPYDLPGACARFVDRLRPGQEVIMETELWPNLFAALSKRGIPLTICNARLSPNSFRGYSRVRGFATQTLARCHAVLAQSQADADRFIALGANPQRVHAVGNIKFDQAISAAQLQAGERLHRRLGRRPCWIAASTHQGEDEAAIAAHQRLCEEHPDALLILVPRHPQRFDAVARLLDQHGLSYLRRSQIDEGDQALPSAAVLLGDSMGEMQMYLQMAQLAFVGGSLVPTGGHNVLEPAALAKPVLFGPHMFNFIAARDLLLAADAAQQVESGQALAAAVITSFAHPEHGAAMGARGQAEIQRNRGTLQRILERLR